MRKITTILLMLVVSISFSQNNPIDFETGGYGADWTWTVFENDDNPPLEIIDNPDPNGINTSARVAQFTAREAAPFFAGVESQVGVDLGTFEWDDDNRTVKIHVWKSVISPVGLKFATETGWAEFEKTVSNTVTEAWEELTFDFSNANNPPEPVNGTLGQIIIFPDYAERDQDNIVYFDNISFHPVGDTPSDEPDVAAPTPPARDPEDVISIFSDAYTNVAGTDFFPWWEQTTEPSIIEIDGNETLKYANFNYQGTQFASPINISEMEYVHIDMWTADATTVNFFLISPPVETPFALPITPNEWVSYDIPLSAFDPVNLNEVLQMMFAGGDGTSTLYLDNIYFYRETVEEGTDASLSDLQVDGTTVPGFSPSVLSYSVELPEGTTVVPTVTVTTNDPDASADVTPAEAIPGTTSVLVTSANGQVERTYTVVFSIESEIVEGPRNPIDFEPDGFGADWTWTVFENADNPALEIIPNPDPNDINSSATVAKFTARQTGNQPAGVESEHGVDLGTFEWNEDNRIVTIHVWKPVISDVGIKFATETGWAEPEIKVANTVINEWEELTFDFSNAGNPPHAENGTLGQIIIFPDFADRDQDNIIYFDNITFSSATGEEAPPVPVGFVASNMIGEDPVGPGEVFLSCGPNDVGGDIVYRLFYSKTDDAPADPTDATEYTFGSTAGDGDGVGAFGFVLGELDEATSYTFWLYQYNTDAELFSPDAATSSTVSGGDIPTEEPDVAAPTPPDRNPEDVISVFSDAYTNVPDTDFFPWWEQTTEPSIVEIEGNETLKYANFNYQGTQFANPLDVTEMETFHLDMWTADASSVNVFLISTGPVETAYALPITLNEWVSYDIPLTEFTGVDLADVIQLKFDGGTGVETIYLDNLYFYRAPTSVSDIHLGEFAVYPNPVRAGDLVIFSTQVRQVDIFDVTGKMIQSLVNTSSVETGGMNRGIYFMRIQSEEGEIQINKLIVK